MRKKNGFSLIELLAVVAILAILALISIPMVQDYVDKSEIKARDINARNLLRAADNYYSYVNMEIGTEFPIVLELPSDELKLTGGQPDSGQVIIYEDGSIYIEAMYGENLYIKYPGDTSIKKGEIINGSYLLWETDGNGMITRYKLQDIIKNEIDFLSEILFMAIDYAQKGDTYNFDYEKSLKENYNRMLDSIADDSTLEMLNMIPDAMNDEIDYILKKFNTSIAITDEETLMSMVLNDSNFVYFKELVSIISEEKILSETNLNTLLTIEIIGDNKNNIIIPNYVKDENGNLEKIRIIGNGAFLTGSSLSDLYNCSIAPNKDTDKGKNVIISDGIETIEKNAFLGCMIETVELPKSIKSIGEGAFSYNRLTTVKLPSRIEYVGGFSSNNLSGEIIIPKSVIEIGIDAFNNEPLSSSNSWCTASYDHLVKLCEGMQGLENKITKVTFEKGSKIESIGQSAFGDNIITTVSIPKSIKFIGPNAFNCSTLTSAYIERVRDNSLGIAATAFGTIIPTYVY